MTRALSIVARPALMLLFSAGPATVCLHAQAPGNPAHAIVLRAELKPGEVLRYELQAGASFLPQSESSEWSLTKPIGPCDYGVTAIVTLRAQPPDKDGNTPVEASYSEVRITSVRCLPLNAADIRKRLAGLQSAPTVFRVGPHGETGTISSSEKSFDYWSSDDLLRKTTQDLLQSQFSVAAVSPGATWKPRGQFAYNADPELGDLDLSAAEIRFRSFVSVAGKRLAWIASKHVFSPLDLPASATTRDGVVLDGAGHSAVAAILELSLLLDPTSHHIGWLHRSQTVDNRLMFALPSGNSEDDPDSDDTNGGSDASGDPPNPVRRALMTFHFQEDGRARLLPADGSMEWLAALRQFEQTAGPEGNTTTVAASAKSPEAIAQAAHVSTLKRTTRAAIDSDSLLATPGGYSRYEKLLCRDTWFCAAASVALPGTVEISEDTPLRSVYLARKDDVAISVALGPALDRQSRGLTEEEELKKQTKYYLANYVWLAFKPGVEASSASATLDGYPGLIVDFSATQRDLSSIHGVLGLILTPWGKVVPISCSSDRSSAEDVRALCEKIILSVSLRR